MKLTSASFSGMGKRPVMRDCLQIRQTDTYALTIVCDGHGACGWVAAFVSTGIVEQRFINLLKKGRIDMAFREPDMKKLFNDIDWHCIKEWGPGTGVFLTIAEMRHGVLRTAHVGNAEVRIKRNGSVQTVCHPHPEGSRSLGDPERIKKGKICVPEITETHVRSGDLVIIGTDGLWNYVTDGEIQGMPHHIRRISSRLRKICEKKSEDNYAAAIVKVNGV